MRPTVISVDMSLIVSLNESLIMNIHVTKSLSGSSSLSVIRYMKINVRISFKVNSSTIRSVNMITRISECDYWYEFELESG